MPALQEQLPAFDTAQLGSLSTCRPQIADRKLLKLTLVCGGLDFGGVNSLRFDDVAEYVQIKLDGKEVCHYRPNEFNALQTYWNVNDDDLQVGYFNIPLERLGVPFSGWGMADVKSFEIVVKLIATLAGGRTFTGLRGYLTYEYAPAAKLGDIITSVASGARTLVQGENIIDDLVVNDITDLSALYFTCPTPAAGSSASARVPVTTAKAINRVTISIGGREVYDLTEFDAVNEASTSPFFKYPAAEFNGFAAFLDMHNGGKGYHRLTDAQGRRLPVRVKFYWNSATLTPITIIVEGVKRSVDVLKP